MLQILSCLDTIVHTDIVATRKRQLFSRGLSKFQRQV